MNISAILYSITQAVIPAPIVNAVVATSIWWLMGANALALLIAWRVGGRNV